MAVGDIVNGIAAGALNFQPAATVSICITSFGGWTSTSNLTDGALTVLVRDQLANQTYPSVTKTMINNTIYLSINPDPNTHYTGIQLQ